MCVNLVGRSCSCCCSKLMMNCDNPREAEALQQSHCAMQPSAGTVAVSHHPMQHLLRAQVCNALPISETHQETWLLLGSSKLILHTGC